jgi:ribose transport system ATP-binding protein
MQSADIISFRRVTKRYPGVVALDDVSFAVRRGETHALVGENGAGKSTLVGLLAGDIVPDGGEIVVDGVARGISSPRVAETLGIGMVHQELYLCPSMSVAANLQIGHEPAALGLFVRRSALRARARWALEQVGLAVDLHIPSSRLTVAQRQLVVIARALLRRASILVFDEPNSALNEQESAQLFTIIGRLRSAGATILYVSHRLDEVLNLADRLTVLRDGHYVATRDVAGVHVDEVIRMMVGRDLGKLLTHEPVLPPARADPVLEITDLTAPPALESVTLTIGAGEIVGVAGLEGSGKEALARALFGMQRVATGRIVVGGKPGPIRSPSTAIMHGMAWIPADRRGDGVVAGMTVEQNIILSQLEEVSRFGFIRHSKARALAHEYMHLLDIHASGPWQKAGTLSGGNQQKVVLARCLARKPRVLVMEEPTAGIDVGAKAEIYAILRRYAAAGNGVLLISSELTELLGVSDRIVVLRSGRVAGAFNRDEATQEAIMECATGVTTIVTR